MRHPRTTTDYQHPFTTNEHKHIRMTAKNNKLHTMSLVLSLAMICVLLPTVMADAEWMSDCGVCHCKWISSKKMAECKNKSLISVPKEMSSELQVIDLSNNIIPELRNNEFRDANLSNLHKIYMRNCTLVEIARDAFRSLNLLIELDLSNNDLKVLHPGVFTDVIRLRVFTIQYNQLEHLDDALFDNLTFLAKVDFRHNQLKSISTHTFVNVSVLREINLEYNQLTLLKEETFRDLDRLSSLTLNENPWNCTCDLQAFQKFAISRRLYTPPTDCHYPMHLRGKLWTDIPAEHFACKPVILYPYDVVTLDATNENITITCRMKGSPKPQIKWLYNNHAINMADPRITIRFAEEANRRDSTEFYVADMTIVGVRNEDRGTYTCVASNTGGEARADTHVAVPPVLESIDGLNVIGSTVGIPTPNDHASKLLFFACLIAIILLTLLIIIVLVLCCYCRRVKRYSKNGSISENGLMTSKMDRSTDGSMLEGSVIMEMQKSLLTEVNPVEKPPRRNEVDGKNCSNDEIPEIRKTLLEDQSFAHHEDETHSIALSDTTPRSRATFVDDGYGTNLPPDLLAFPPRYPQTSSTQSSMNNLPEGNLYIKSPVASPIYQQNIYGTTGAGYRTLQHPKNRNLAIINRANSPFQPAPILYTPIVMKQGYVTIPRKPRTPSWAPSIASTLIDFPPTSPTSTISTELAIDPIYDNLGLRTSASGHSALSVNKPGSKTSQSQQQQQQQQQHTLQQQQTQQFVQQQQPLQATIAAASVSNAVDLQAAAHAAAVAAAAGGGAGPSFVTMRDRPLPATPRIYEPLQEQQIFPSNGGEINGCNDDTEHLLFNKSVESSPIIVSAHAINNNTISNSTSNSNLSNLANNNSGSYVEKMSNVSKVPPRPPPKPKKKMPTISAITENANGENGADARLFQDECEDGTEV